MANLVRVIIVIGLIAGTAAYASGNDRQSHTAAFQCGDKRLQTRFLDGSLELTIDDKTYMLARVRAASGAKYETGQGRDRVVFWNKGDKARLEVRGEAYRECREIAPSHAAEPLPFKASGNQLTCLQANRFLTNTHSTIRAATPSRARNGGATKISGANTGSLYCAAPPGTTRSRTNRRSMRLVNVTW